ncbi:chromosome-anchoring protein RacA [Alkalihalobacillus oceani]|uniref:chromosome-anchoring protein RacA n=1 Tax=Halalkalibacter oceani TaxID=1653776 RepID=UPI00203E7EA1|nr:chromosome-anchoring protein RacA [Halalkalibacter oceani]MCM3761272.1 chromosome-anchoring protein RacA [Halalkalibacter oceani]
MKTWKTKDVSEQLGVNPTTVQRWVKYFGLDCETNEHGHYQFTAEHVEIMKHIQQELALGKRMREITFEQYPGMKEERPAQLQQTIDTELYEKKLQEVMKKVQELEYRLSKKADEVVSYQLLKHRSELEEMMKLIKGLEKRLAQMEQKIDYPQHGHESELPLVAGDEVKKKRRTLMQLFSF